VPFNVIPGQKGPFMTSHELSMVGSDANSPGGHTVFCNNNPMNGWSAACAYLFGVK
jgi:hypothetical protein